jgi:MGT family glycosyltransferase
MSVSPLTVLFMPESAYGPTNNCIGIGDVLRRRGHRVVFAAEASWKGKLAALGFEEALFDLAPPSEDGGAGDAGQFWKDFIRDTAIEFRRPTIEQLETFMAPTWQALIDGAKYCEPQLQSILASVMPDVVVEDNVVCFPALMTAGVPFVRILSCNPLEMTGLDVPPPYSGLAEDDRSGWERFRTEYERTHRAVWDPFNTWVQAQGAPPLPYLEFIHSSETLNLYVYPEVIDYITSRPLDATWHQLDSSVRQTDEEFELPAPLRDRPDGSALIYLSLGSLGSADVELMRRLVDVLGRTPHRFIVSKGPRHDEYELAPNMWGAEFLPQTRVIPLVNLVITHGGNNTVTEAFHFGKPMILLPLFWDQHDNAQRVDESGFGVRLDTYTFSDDQMRDALARLLNDDALRNRLDDIGSTIRNRNGVAAAAERIEAAGRPHTVSWPIEHAHFHVALEVEEGGPQGPPPKPRFAR